MPGTKGGRPADQTIYLHFDKKSFNDKTKRWTVTCKYCSKDVIHRELRCLAHLAHQCKEILQEERQAVNVELMNRGGGVILEVSNEDVAVGVSGGSSGVSTSDHPTKKQKVGSGQAVVVTGMGSFVDRVLTPQEQAVANTRLLRWFIHGNIPLSQADNYFFHKWVGNIRPSYSPASRFVLTSTYLPAEEARAYQEDINRLANKQNLTYLMDGWEDTMKRSLYGCLLSEVGEFPVVLALKELTGIRANADNLVSVANEALKWKHVDSRAIVAVCTDNPTVMQAFRRKWTEEHPHILQFPCFIHGVNTIMGKVASYPIIKALIKSNTKIVSFFNMSHYWGGQLEQLAKENNVTRRLKQNTESRFYAVILQALSIQEHRKVLTELCMRDDAQRAVNGLSPVNRDVILSVLEVGRWSLNEEFIKICKPLVDLIGDTESRDVTLADCMIHLIWAQQKIMTLKEDDFDDKAFLQHAKQTTTHYFHAMNTDLHWLTLFLHPLCRKLAITTSEHSRTIKDAFVIALDIAGKWDWPRGHAEQLVKDIQAYANEEPPFVGGKADAIAWWKSVNIGFHPIQVLGLKLMSIVPHAAEVERFFSNLGGVQSAKRSRLTVSHLASMGMLRNHYNRQLHEAAIAEGKDPRRRHGHMHISAKGINTDRVDALTDTFSTSPPLPNCIEDGDIVETESFALQELEAEYKALEHSAFEIESGDRHSAEVPVKDIYDLSLIEKIRQGQLPTFENMIVETDIVNNNEKWDSASLLSQMGV